MQEDILAVAKKAGQQHLVNHYKSIKNKETAQKFLKQLENVDFDQMNQLFNDVYLKHKNGEQGEKKVEYEPLEKVDTREDIKKNEEQYDKIGFESISKGEAGICIMSGGQGTRLGFDHPKGMFNIKLESGYTLFQYFAKRLLRLMELAKSKFPDTKFTGKNMIKWYLMTSQMNHEEIVTYFKENNYFGYDPQSIYFFPQGGIPASDYNGKLIIQSEESLALAPAGNGAIYQEMKKNGAIKHMKENGVKYIYIGAVDNVLLKLADPTCLGFMIKNKLQIASTYVKKAYPEQKIGIHVNLNGRVQVQQYSEVPKEIMQKKKDGELLYCHGNRATLFMATDFIERITHDEEILKKINKKYHLAEKKIKNYDSKTGKSQKPEKNNGVKFELFYFDVFEETDKFGLFETIRQEEFAPVKNAQGLDSPDSAKTLLRNLHLKWVKQAGIPVQGEGFLEIDPRVSYNGEGLKQIIDKNYGGKVKLPIFIK